MKKPYLLICVFLLYSMVGNCAWAKTVVSAAEFRDKIANNKIGTIYLDSVDKGIGGLEVNQYGLVTDDVLVLGNFNKIPDDLLKLAKEHNVTIANSEGYGSSDETSSTLMMIGLLPRLLYIFVLFVILVFLILINQKLSRIIEMLTKKDQS